MASSVLTPDQRRQTLPTQRLEAAIGATLAVDAERRERLCEAFHAKWAKVGELEQPADKPARRLADDDIAWLREGLEPRR